MPCRYGALNEDVVLMVVVVVVDAQQQLSPTATTGEVKYQQSTQKRIQEMGRTNDDGWLIVDKLSMVSTQLHNRIEVVHACELSRTKDMILQ